PAYIILLSGHVLLEEYAAVKAEVLYLAAILDPRYKMYGQACCWAACGSWRSYTPTRESWSADLSRSQRRSGSNLGSGCNTCPRKHNARGSTQVETVPDTCYCLETAMELVGCKICKLCLVNIRPDLTSCIRCEVEDSLRSIVKASASLQRYI
ncbi:hypothetical protein HaLaN_29080, partial [Haematococcus lacustris]